MSKKEQTLPSVRFNVFLISVFQLFFFFLQFLFSYSNNLIIFNSIFCFWQDIRILLRSKIFTEFLSTEALFNSIKKSCSPSYLACFHNGRQIIRSVLIYRLTIYLPPFLLPSFPRLFFSSFLSLFLVFLFFFNLDSFLASVNFLLFKTSQ